MNPKLNNELSTSKLVSPLVIFDRLLTLAQQADDAGYGKAARRVLKLAMSVLDEPPEAELAVTRRELAIPA